MALGAQNTGTSKELVELLMSIGISIVTRITDNDEVESRFDSVLVQAEDLTTETLRPVALDCGSVTPSRNDNAAQKVEAVRGPDQAHSPAGLRRTFGKYPVNLATTS